MADDELSLRPDPVVAWLRTQASRITRQMLADVMATVNHYGQASPAQRIAYLRDIRASFGVVMECLAANRPMAEDEAEIFRSIGKARRGEVPLEDLLSGVGLCKERGTRELRTRSVAGVSPGLEAQLARVFVQIQQCMIEGYDRDVGAAPQRARRPPASASDQLIIIASSLEARLQNLTSAMAFAVLTADSTLKTRAIPGFEQELRSAVATSFATFVRVVAENRRMTTDERADVAAFAARGIHAKIPTRVILRTIRSAGVVGVRSIITDFVIEEPWVMDTGVFSTVIDRALEFIDDMAEGLRVCRSEGLRMPLPAGGFFDARTDGLVPAEGGLIPLTRREASVLRVLLRHQGKFRSASQLAMEVPEARSEYVDAHAVEMAISRLRRKLALTGHRGEASLVTRRGIGYAVPLAQQPVQ
jgi:hypothetical protein